ncbi:hypothetical protein TIFTF001_009529 [Ficus carica]|uniref:Uncharacterized protein n=1 Tax=Ficus carica TaxID=3494 RepID=A0AA87ZUU9_FICCA|nr:hypothetical protein TIFTF001_009529 [Ficus carica]
MSSFSLHITDVVAQLSVPADKPPDHDRSDDTFEGVTRWRMIWCSGRASNVKMGSARCKETKRKVIPGDPLACVDHQGAFSNL